MKKSNHWSNYWEGGQLTSLPQDFKLNYQGSIYEEWIDCFKRLPKKSKVLDLCAGNCAISLLAATYSNEGKREFNITAIDAANISKQNIVKKFPQQKEYLEKIKVISNCRVEDINIESSCIDLIVSQYGIEYCDWVVSAKQISRLLKKGGEFTMITHSCSTEIVTFMEVEKNDYKFLNNIGLFKNLKKYGNNKISHRIFMKQLNIIQPKIVKEFKEKPSQLLKSILMLLDNIYNTESKQLQGHKTELLNICNQHKFAFARLNDLLGVIDSIAKDPDWFKVFINEGLEMKQKKTIIQNENVNSGTLYQFVKK